MNLKPPRKKRNTRFSLANRNRFHPPLPIFVKTQNGTFTDDSLTPTFRGYYSGYYVVIENEHDTETLYNMGCFGKGSLSRSFPSFAKRSKGIPPVIQETQWERRLRWIEKLQKAFDYNLCNLEANDDNSAVETTKDSNSVVVEKITNSSGERNNEDAIKIENTSHSEDNEILVISDLNMKSPDLNPRLESELVETVVEIGRLSLEEAFFLSYGLGCLEIVNLGSILSPGESWNMFKGVQKDFIESYVAYHHYRAKGWVVKTGLKYGGHYLLYNKGPSFYHASYVVIIKNIKKPDSEDEEGVLWDVTFLNRIAEQSNKDVLICHIQWPSLDSNDYNNPDVLRRFRVTDVILGRWSASAALSSEDIVS